MKVYDKNSQYKAQSTPILQPKFTVDFFQEKFKFKDGTPVREYIQTVEFKDEEEFDKFREVNNF